MESFYMGYICKVFRTNEMMDSDISDFIEIHRAVFDSSMTLEYFGRKYLKNIYGESIIAIIYDSWGHPAAARALWRNDIHGQEAYQPVDTGVRTEHQRKGLFVLMTEQALEEVPASAVIYNFPNMNSFRQYIKLGWTVKKELFTRMFSTRKYVKENPQIIDSDYLRWWIIPEGDGLGYVKKRNDYYLVKKSPKLGRYSVIGKIQEKDTALLNRIKWPLLLTYMSSKKSFYNRKDTVSSKVVSKNAAQDVDIPYWKIDVI